MRCGDGLSRREEPSETFVPLRRRPRLLLRAELGLARLREGATVHMANRAEFNVIGPKTAKFV